MTARVLEIELSQPVPERIDCTGYAQAYVVLRDHRTPVGALRVACPAGSLSRNDVWAAICADSRLVTRLRERSVKRWQEQQSAEVPQQLPTWTVIVCTRDRTSDLRRCLDGLMQLDLTDGEILVVDNAPSDVSTEQLVARYPVQYVREDRPGLNWARSRGARVAHGEIVIYTDDDVVVDADWVANMLVPFAQPRVAATTGLILPLELENDIQELFEAYGGFSRGFYQRTFDSLHFAPAAAGQVGAGASMAFRRNLVVTMGLFDVELDCGTVTRTGGDIYALYRLLAYGYLIVYTPEALVWHRHRRDYTVLRKTLVSYSVGGYAYLTRCLLQHGDCQALLIAGLWFSFDHVQQLKRTFLQRPNALPLDLVLAQIAAIPLGPWAYFASRKAENQPSSVQALDVVGETV